MLKSEIIINIPGTLCVTPHSSFFIDYVFIREISVHAGN